jgi:hypothetical protein
MITDYSTRLKGFQIRIIMVVIMDNLHMGRFIIYTLHHETEEVEMSETCSTHGENEKLIYYLVEKLKGIDHLGDLDVDGRIIFKCILKKHTRVSAKFPGLSR